MNRIFYRSAKAAIVCYDLTDGESWDKAKEWILELRAHERDCLLYICGTKLDLVNENKYLRRVKQHKAQDFASGIGATYFETSSKTGENVDALFETIIADFGARPSNFELSDSIILHEKTSPYGSSCVGCPCWLN
ncbi:hypothetical protein QYM36_011393 [Artemia franciscana]|nr:hypothetical protein QYM36_011393 [Artemia franciscana]KAK2712691.1 hypothetical protein QYM36_011393 [Artemia franciscana]